MVTHATPKVMLVDDNELLRATLGRWAASSHCLQVVGSFADGQGVHEAARAARPDVVLLDYHIPGTDTLALTRELTAAGLRVVLLSGYTDKDVISACIDAGAVGFLSKQLSPSEIARHVADAISGNFALCETSLAALSRRA
ncbi:MAG TPA: response regulator transcription factor [Phycisphaerales bacterium]|nr:response regulator transcription factor [Phycisphaerales bacterium]